MPKYTTEAQLESFLDTTITAGDADDFMDQAEAFIDSETGRNFKADTSASARRFRGTDKKLLVIDDCVEITKVEKANDHWGDSLTTISSDDYILQPRNHSAEGIPIKGIFYKHGFWGIGEGGLENHKITAKWGYSVDPPDDIVFAATILAAGLYSANRSEGGVESERIGNYQVKYANDNWGAFNRAIEILNNYKQYKI